MPVLEGRLPLQRGQLAGGLVVLMSASVLVFAVGLAVGTRALPLADLVAVLAGGYEGDAAIIVWEQRLPRTILGLAVGAALGVAGVAAQGLTRNPLADPALLGVSAGAALAVVVATSFLGARTLPAHILWATVGAALAGGTVLLLAGREQVRASSTELILAGVAISALLAAVTTTLVLLDAQTLEEYRFWAVGALSGRGNSTAAIVVPMLALAGLLGLLCARWLDVLALGDDAARALGIRVRPIRLAVGGTVVLLTGAAVAATGPIGFVGLAVPHAARALTGVRHGWLLPYAALIGGILLVLADVLGRVVVRPGELQVGIVTAVVGAPFVLVLLRQVRMAAR